MIAMRERQGGVREKGETGTEVRQRREGGGRKKLVEEEKQRGRRQQMEQLKRVVQFNS